MNGSARRKVSNSKVKSVLFRASVRLALSAVVLVGLHNAQASTLTLGQASTFGVFVFGNFTETGTDSQGRVAVGGNFTPLNNGGFSIASASSDPTGTYDLVVGGNFTNNGYSQGGGDAFVGGNLTWTDPSAPHNVTVNGTFTDSSGGSVGGAVSYYGGYSGPGYLTKTQMSSLATSPINFVSAQSQLTSVSSALASQSANGTTSFDGYSTYTLTGSSSSLNVFTLTGSPVTGATINITAPASSTVVVNVTGTSDSFSGGTITLNGVPDTNVIFNFATATSVEISNLAFYGTVLAPGAAFTGNGGQLNGQLIADSVQGTATGNTEFHNVLFSGTLPTATPEPSTLMMLIGGVALVAISRRRKASRN